MNFLGFFVAFMSFFLLIPAIISFSGYFNFFKETFCRNRNGFVFYGRTNNKLCIFLNDGYNPFFEKVISIPDFLEIFYLKPEEMKQLAQLELNNEQKTYLLKQLKESSKYHQYDLYELSLLDEEINSKKLQVEKQNLETNAELIALIGINSTR